MCMWVVHLCMNQNLPKGRETLNPLVKLAKGVTGSGLFIDLKLACAVHIEYFADLIF